MRLSQRQAARRQAAEQQQAPGRRQAAQQQQQAPGRRQSAADEQQHAELLLALQEDGQNGRGGRGRGWRQELQGRGRTGRN